MRGNILSPQRSNQKRGPQQISGRSTNRFFRNWFARVRDAIGWVVAIGASASQIQWAFNAYTVVLGGHLVERCGRKRIMHV
jgi:glutamate dehydrogenase/leucine dehydrogenase